MLTDNPYDSSRNNLPLMRYQITQTHEVLKEFVSHISSFVTRNYVYTDKAIPEEIKKLEEGYFAQYGIETSADFVVETTQGGTI